MDTRSSANTRSSRPLRWRGGLFGPLVAAILPMIAAGFGVYMLGWAEDVYADRALPTLTAWVFSNRWIVALLMLPAVLCGIAAAFTQRRYLLYGPYMLLFMGPILLIIGAFAWLIISIYADEIQSAM